jgi:hypothetical protein
MKNIYYVYEYLREDLTPYYVGKGSNLRWKEKHYVNLPPLERIRFVSTNLTEEEAFKLEIELIAKYGRKDIGTGILRNQTNGGDGTSGHVHSEETKTKMSLARIKENAKRKENGWIYPQEARDKISSMWKNKPKTTEHVEKVRTALNSRSDEEKAQWAAKIAASKIGKPMSDETKRKLSTLNKGKILPKTECCGKLWDPGNLAKHRKSGKCDNLF